ncbi:MAG: hypothetical protein QF701_05505 [Nitrospinota bacterium]|jgi:hypothetical protein|nr:hypothetical protein [Nitrospinota bacterium]MDP7167198.1 hypothetical protein [Nitrospinota bacterium]MDP7369228.1 hypothetical protein [Nitrospinota bacterium]MDP7505683.1 hypothetical protein [Nitrospinota bacterium]MDP7664133.1 hypothetical protein [Nitrospinota bacterium]|tara:strand:- start:423 stop:665 length:243 start_codon:yes stop_codon:yes gene_type:complete
MPRVPELPDTPDDPLARELFAHQIENDGFVFNPSRVLGHRPSILRGIGQLQRGVNESGLLGGDLKALVNVRVASINGCPF